jgi:hypothetical protein
MHIFFKSNCSNWDIGGHSRFVAILFIWTDWGSNQGFSVFAVNINIRENRWGNLRSEYCAYKWQNESNKINTKQMSNMDPTKTQGWTQVFVEGIYIYIWTLEDMVNIGYKQLFSYIVYQNQIKNQKVLFKVGTFYNSTT